MYSPTPTRAMAGTSSHPRSERGEAPGGAAGGSSTAPRMSMVSVRWTGAGQALAAGKPVLEVIYDAMLEDEGKELLYFPIYNYASGTLAEVGEMLSHPHAMLGLGDGGAHVGTICDASMSTYFLLHWARDRKAFSIEQAIAKLSSEPAAWMGYADRGRLVPGLRADAVVIDLDRLSLERPKLVHDLPAGGRRFLQPAHGYRATIVRGEVIAEDGALTGARPGRIARAS